VDRRHYQPSPPSDITVNVEPDGDRWTLVFVKDLVHDREKVWAALTDPGQIDAWAPFRSDRDLGQTSPATLTLVDGEDETSMSATVGTAERPSLLVYNWGDDLLQWQLVATAGGTRLTLRHTTAKRDDVPTFAAGWHLCLDVLDLTLGGTAIGAIRGREAMDFGFGELRDSYAARLA
jgi:uncharacterized protein YndB with AHSA1/START domain